MSVTLPPRKPKDSSTLLKAASGAEFKQEIGLSVGGRLGISITPRLGFPATGTYVPSNLRFALDGSEQTTDASLFIGAGKLSFFLLPLTSPVSFQLNGGIALVKRSGEAYRNLVDKTSIGGTVGAQMGFRLGPLPAIQLGVETYLYKQNVEGLTTVSGEQASQKDVQLSIGFGIHWDADVRRPYGCRAFPRGHRRVPDRFVPGHLEAAGERVRGAA
ncbi:MAG: hypothetical protein H0T44_07745 [Gemmatimonadales bacterium]|nr:hypothetical protein [Gemmatimonadales bacterium]